jgi:hypothetical protein
VPLPCLRPSFEGPINLKTFSVTNKCQKVLSKPSADGFAVGRRQKREEHVGPSANTHLYNSDTYLHSESIQSSSTLPLFGNPVTFYLIKLLLCLVFKFWLKVGPNANKHIYNRDAYLHSESVQSGSTLPLFCNPVTFYSIKLLLCLVFKFWLKVNPSANKHLYNRDAYLHSKSIQSGFTLPLFCNPVRFYLIKLLLCLIFKFWLKVGRSANKHLYNRDGYLHLESIQSVSTLPLFCNPVTF